MLTAGSQHVGPLQIDIVRDGEQTDVMLSGELDLSTVSQVRNALDRVERDCPACVLLDLERLRFMDVSGLHVVLDAQTALGERLLMTPGRPEVARLFTLAGLDRELRWTVPSEFTLARRNVAYVRELYLAWRSHGVEAMLKLVPRDVEWRPSQAAGRALRGSEQLQRFWSGTDPQPVVDPACFTVIGDDVLIETEHMLNDGTTTRMSSLYEFSGRQLTRARARRRLLTPPV